MVISYKILHSASSRFFLGLVFFCLLHLKLEAFFCGCIPKDYQDFRVFAAPQIARLNLKINHLGVYRGVMTGGSFGVEYKPFCNFYSGVFAEWMMGPVYSPSSMSRYIHDFDTQARLGYNVPMWNFYKLTFTPFLGLGYIQEIHHVRPDLVLDSLRLRYTNYYLPYGALVDFSITKHFAFGFVIEKRICIVERLNTPYIEKVEFLLDQKSGYLFEVPFFLKFGKAAKFQLSLIPYLKREVDGKLEARLPDGAALSLPMQDYRYWGFRLGLGVVF